MKYLLVVSTCICIYLASKVCQYFGFYPKDSMFYAANSLWSLLIIIIVTSIQRSKLTLAISLANIGHIILSMMSCYEYMTLEVSNRFVYVHYAVILHSLNFIEVLLLIMGAPGARMDRKRTKLGCFRFYRSSTGSRSPSIN